MAQRLITFIANLGDLKERPTAAKKLAHELGAENVILFTKDPALNVLLPAPGFPQTLPNGRKWKSFISECQKNRHWVAELQCPFNLKITHVMGVLAADGSVLAFLGGKPDLQLGVEVSILVPLLAAALHNERVTQAARGQVETASASTRSAQELVKALSESRRDLEAALIQKEKALVTRDEFLSIASHELRTPLTGLSMQLQMLMRSLKKANGSMISPDDILKKVSSASSQASQLGKLIDSLLDVSRLDSGRISLDRETIDLSLLVKEVAARFEEQANTSQIPIQVSTPKKIFGQWDPLRITQTISNLISNAMKYGAGKPIEISVTSENELAKVCVRDHGIGIAPENQKKIFERFERAIAHNNISGLGLGLFIASQIAEAHGGRITVESEKGNGSNFVLMLPTTEEAHLLPMSQGRNIKAGGVLKSDIT